jgi:hypothetical protein
LKRLIIVSTVLAVAAIAIAAIGGSFASASPQPQLEKASVPSVVGLKLPAAESELRAAGYKPKPFNTDTLFGIVVARHYTVCHQWPPVGDSVKILAQKYGC